MMLQLVDDHGNWERDFDLPESILKALYNEENDIDVVWVGWNKLGFLCEATEPNEVSTRKSKDRPNPNGADAGFINIRLRYDVDDPNHDGFLAYEDRENRR